MWLQRLWHAATGMPSPSTLCLCQPAGPQFCQPQGWPGASILERVPLELLTDPLIWLFSRPELRRQVRRALWYRDVQGCVVNQIVTRKRMRDWALFSCMSATLCAAWDGAVIDQLAENRSGVSAWLIWLSANGTSDGDTDTRTLGVHQAWALMANGCHFGHGQGSTETRTAGGNEC